MNDNAMTFHVPGIGLLPSACAVAIQGELVPLTRSEFRVLQFLASNAGIAFTRQQIIAAVHGPDYPATDRSVDVQIAALRKKLSAQAKLIETVRGVGYRVQPPIIEPSDKRIPA